LPEILLVLDNFRSRLRRQLSVDDPIDFIVIDGVVEMTAVNTMLLEPSDHLPVLAWERACGGPGNARRGGPDGRGGLGLDDIERRSDHLKNFQPAIDLLRTCKVALLK